MARYWQKIHAEQGGLPSVFSRQKHPGMKWDTISFPGRFAMAFFLDDLWS
ncbi:MAG: hypothetical protein Q4F76_11040 [Lachnospiraceae bacterium]|nr:hypothetical protein [Lachnospiraceae bacterium]